MRTTQVHADLRPCGKVARSGHSAADGSSWCLLGVTDRPVLLEGLCTVDGWLVGTSGLEDVVGCTVASNATLLGGGGRWVVATVRLDDVVLNQRAASPPIDREVAVAVWLIGTAVVDGPVKQS